MAAVMTSMRIWFLAREDFVGAGIDVSNLMDFSSWPLIAVYSQPFITEAIMKTFRAD